MTKVPHAPNHGRDPLLPRGTDRCRCTVCGLYFTSSYAFSRHRIGKVGIPGRRCLMPEELSRRGWIQIPSGHWATRARRHKPLKPDPSPKEGV